MPQLEKVKLRLSGRKTQACVACGSRFSYRIEHTRSGSGATQNLAWQSALTNCAMTLRWHVERHPCPKCGAYQPNMFVNRRSLLHLLMSTISFVVLALPFLLLTVKFDAFDLFLGLERLTNVSLAVLGGWCTTLVALFLVALHLAIARRNPNRDREANLRQAAKEVMSGELTLEEKIETAGPTPPAGLLGIAGNRRFALMMMGLSAFAPLAVETTRRVCGWHANPGWFPAVVSPGDETFAFFDESIRTLDNGWAGTTRARITNAQELHLASEMLPSHTKQNYWGTNPRDEKPSHTTTSVWVGVNVPDVESLVEQTMTIELTAQVQFAEPHASGVLANEKRGLRTVRELRLSDRYAGVTYNTLWWNGEYVVVVCLVIGGAWLWWQDDILRRFGDGPNFLPDNEAQIVCA